MVGTIFDIPDLVDELSDVDRYIKEIEENWVDPLPPPVVEEHEGFQVVREDLINGSSKVRASDYLVSTLNGIEELVYGSCPATGHAQIALSVLAKRYGMKSVVFMAERSLDKLTKQQKHAIREGVDFRWVKMGMLNVTEKHAKDYANENEEKRLLVPIGVDHPAVVAGYAVIARRMGIQPKEVWTVGSSGTLTRGLQQGWPDADFYCVSVGHKGDYGRAKVYRCPLTFPQEVRLEDTPPFPSVSNYDAKAWKYMREYASDGALFWNVGS